MSNRKRFDSSMLHSDEDTTVALIGGKYPLYRRILFDDHYEAVIPAHVHDKPARWPRGFITVDAPRPSVHTIHEDKLWTNFDGPAFGTQLKAYLAHARSKAYCMTFSSFDGYCLGSRAHRQTSIFPEDDPLLEKAFLMFRIGGYASADLHPKLRPFVDADTLTEFRLARFMERNAHTQFDRKMPIPQYLEALDVFTTSAHSYRDNQLYVLTSWLNCPHTVPITLPAPFLLEEKLRVELPHDATILAGHYVRQIDCLIAMNSESNYLRRNDELLPLVQEIREKYSIKKEGKA